MKGKFTIERLEHLLRWMRDKLVAGLFVVIPLVVTLWVLVLVYNLINSFSEPVVQRLVTDIPSLRALVPPVMLSHDATANTYSIYGAGFVLTLCFLVGLGVLATNVFGERIVDLLERLLLRVPLVSTIYHWAKQVVDAFKSIGSAESGLHKAQVVFLPYPDVEGGYIPGFLTGRYTNASGVTMAVVFVPTSPNPVTGFIMVMEASQVILGDITMEETWKMIVSAGLVTPQPPKERPTPVTPARAPDDTRQKE